MNWFEFDPSEGFAFDEEKHLYTFRGKPVPSVTEICDILSADKYGKINEATVRAAAVRGTRVHELTELYDMDAMPDEFEYDSFPYLKAWAAFCRDYQPDWLFTEKKLWGYTYCGTADRIGVIDGVPVIVDMKTVSQLDRIAKISLACQLWAYYLLADSNGIPMTGTLSFYNSMGVHLMKDGTYRVYKVSDIENKYDFSASELFSDLLKIKQLQKGLKKDE